MTIASRFIQSYHILRKMMTQTKYVLLNRKSLVSFLQNTPVKIETFYKPKEYALDGCQHLGLNTVEYRNGVS